MTAAVGTLKSVHHYFRNARLPAVKDCILVRGDGSPVPFIGQIRDIEVAASGKSREVNMHVAWFYRPEEAQGGRKARCSCSDYAVHFLGHALC